MKEIPGSKCGSPEDRKSIVCSMAPKCAGINGGHPKDTIPGFARMAVFILPQSSIASWPAPQKLIQDMS
jgi:hypothetical protein